MIGSQMQGSLPAAAVNGILGGVNNGISAAGSAQADATELKFVATHFISTAAASTGVRLPAGMNPGESMIVFNGGASTVAVYPPVGGTINNIAANGNFDVATLKSVVLVCVLPLKFIAMLGA